MKLNLFYNAGRFYTAILFALKTKAEYRILGLADINLKVNRSMTISVKYCLILVCFKKKPIPCLSNIYEKKESKNNFAQMPVMANCELMLFNSEQIHIAEIMSLRHETFKCNFCSSILAKHSIISSL